MSEPPSDHKIFVPNLISFIVLLLFGLIFLSFGAYGGIGILISGVILVFGSILNLVIYLEKPEKKKQKALAKWEKKQAKKG